MKDEVFRDAIYMLEDFVDIFKGQMPLSHEEESLVESAELIIERSRKFLKGR